MKLVPYFLTLFYFFGAFIALLKCGWGAAESSLEFSTLDFGEMFKNLESLIDMFGIGENGCSLSCKEGKC